MRRLLVGLFMIGGCANPGVRQKSAVRVDVGVVFKHEGDLRLTGDVYLPDDSNANGAAVVVVHGGGWARRSGDMSQLCRRLAREGFVAFNATYRLAPTHHFPESVEDVRDAVRWLRSHSARYRIDERAVAAWGYSAGANLVLLAGLDPRLGLSAIVAGGTPADLTAWPDSTMVRNFVGGSFTEKPEAWRAASPVTRVEAQSPPVFLYHGAWDRIVEKQQMVKMASALRERQREVETLEVPYLGHIAVYYFSQEAITRGTAFLQRHLGRKI